MCVAHGHGDAWSYPLGMLEDESNLIIERENGRIISESQTLVLGIGGMLSKESAKAFTDRLKQLNVQIKPVAGLFDG